MKRVASEQQVTLLGIDPFTISEDASFPPTMGDFIKACENVPA
jgi:hypothetical protein